MLRHGEETIEEAEKDDTGIEPEGAVEAKPGEELGEQLGEDGHGDAAGKKDEGAAGASEFSRKHFADDQLQT